MCTQYKYVYLYFIYLYYNYLNRLLYINLATTLLVDVQRLYPLHVVHVALTFITQNGEMEIRKRFAQNDMQYKMQHENACVII